MKRLTADFWLAIFKLLNIMILIGGLNVILAIPGWAAGTVGYASDLIKPQITVMSPLPDSIADTDTPKIEIACIDTGSDIDESSIRLILDRIDVTGLSTIERSDITGQAMYSRRIVIYRPSAPLSQGIHEVNYSVRDMAGNLAELRWRFEVKGEEQGGVRIGGSNTYCFDATPIYKNTDTLDLTAQSQFQESSLQLHLVGRITDYPGLTPDYYDSGYNFYYDQYSLTYNRRAFSMAMGCTSIALNSELLQTGLEMKGGIIQDRVDLSSGRLNWSVFSGDSGSSYGIGISVYTITGFSGEWSSSSNWGLGGYYVKMDDDRTSYKYGGITGNMMLNDSILFRYELIQGNAAFDNRYGYGTAVHLDGIVAATNLGFDYYMLQPDYPTPGSASTAILTGGGTERYAIRSDTDIGNGQSIQVDASIALDNPEKDFTTRKNLNIGYNLNRNPDYTFSSVYQWDIQYTHSIVNKTNNQLWLKLQKTLNDSTIETSASILETRQADNSKSLDLQLFEAWQKPIGSFNLTPSVQWTNHDAFDGKDSTATDIRLTLDKQFAPDLSRSKVAIYQKREETTDDSSVVYNTGMEVIIAMRLWQNTSLNLSGNCSKWSKEEPDGSEDGWNKGFQLSLKTVF